MPNNVAFPLRPRLGHLIPLKRRRLKRHRLGLRPGDQPGREVVVDRIAPCDPATLLPTPSPPGEIKGKRRGRLLRVSVWVVRCRGWGKSDGAFTRSYPPRGAGNVTCCELICRHSFGRSGVIAFFGSWPDWRLLMHPNSHNAIIAL